jgi:hypothetical protein
MFSASGQLREYIYGMTGDLDPNSQIAYYAKTFGVDLPGPH